MKRILIVEDEKTISELQKDYLEINGFEAEIKHNGHEGLERALTSDFDLIVLDVMLPGLDGFAVCKKNSRSKRSAYSDGNGSRRRDRFNPRIGLGC